MKLLNLTKTLHRTSKLIILPLAIACATVSAHGQTISVNFDEDVSTALSGQLTGTTGIVPQTPSQFNEVAFGNTSLGGPPFATTTNTQTLFDSTGRNFPGLTLSAVYGNNYQTGVTSFGNILQTYLDRIQSLTLTNVPFTSYDVYVYVDSDRDGRGGIVTDVGTATTLTYVTSANSATSLNYNSDPAVINPPVTALEFTGNTASTLALTFAGNFGGSNSGVAAIQIVNTGVELPEPSSFGMIAVSLGALLGFLAIRRKRLLA